MKKAVLLPGFIYAAQLASMAQTRVVLIEQFTNSGCPPCAASSPAVYQFADAHPGEVVEIAYHTAFPYTDSMYLENPAESTQRVNYYSVSGVPHSVLDGNYYSGASGTFLPTIATTVNNRLTIAPNYSIQNLSLSLAGNTLNGTFEFTSLNDNNIADNVAAHIVLIEKNVLKNSYAASPGANSENEYGYVMRKMLPDANGTVLLHKLLNEKDTVQFSWNLSHIKDINELRAVAFVQNNATKEILEAQVYTPQLSTAGIVENKFLSGQVIAYPNPASDELMLAFGRQEFITDIRFYNQLGELMLLQPVNTITAAVRIPINLKSGIYYVKISGTSGSAFKKISVIH